LLTDRLTADKQTPSNTWPPWRR